MPPVKELLEQLKMYAVFHKPSFIVPEPYLHPIQAGRECSPVKLNMEGDNDGENISALNERVCELSVLYNVWKNRKYLPAPYWGLCHYRRYFTLNIHWTIVKKKAAYYLEENQRNFKKVFSPGLSSTLLQHLEPGTVILPVTVTLKNVSVEQHYCNDHEKAGWDIMRIAIEKLHPEYVKDFIAVGNNNLFYPYNMMIAHYSVWEKYLEWLFTIVFYINEHYNFSNDPYQSRAIGFMAERLHTVYFHHHNHEYTIVNLPVAVFKP